MAYQSKDLLYHDHEHGPECRDEDGDVVSWVCPFMLANPQQATGETEFSEARGKARLTHSCGEWEIGGPDEVLALTLDLIALRRKMLGQVPVELRTPDHVTAARALALLDIVLDAADGLKATLAARDEQIANMQASIGELINRVRDDEEIISDHRQQHTDSLVRITELERSVKFCPHRQEGMGILLGAVDAASEMRPPDGTSVDDTLDRFSAALDRHAAESYGADDWTAFKAAVRAQTEASN